MELYNALIQMWLTTSKTKRDIYYSNLSTRVASGVAEQLRILGNKKMLNLGGDIP